MMLNAIRAVQLDRFETFKIAAFIILGRFSYHLTPVGKKNYHTNAIKMLKAWWEREVRS